jgi:hypothetical protein
MPECEGAGENMHSVLQGTTLDWTLAPEEMRWLYAVPGAVVVAVVRCMQIKG